MFAIRIEQISNDLVGWLTDTRLTLVEQGEGLLELWYVWPPSCRSYCQVNRCCRAVAVKGTRTSGKNKAGGMSGSKISP